MCQIYDNYYADDFTKCVEIVTVVVVSYLAVIGLLAHFSEAWSDHPATTRLQLFAVGCALCFVSCFIED